MRRNMNCAGVLAVLIGFGLAVPVEAQSLIFVDDDAPAGGGGASWASAFNNLQDALASAVAGDEIWVAAGTYRPDDGAGQTPGDREATFQLINGVVLYGGLAGDEDSAPFDLNDRDLAANATILTGDLASDDGGDFANNEENSYHVITGSATDVTAVLDGVTVTGGNADSSTPHNVGGGMHNDSGSPTLINCTFSGNSAIALGAGMRNEVSSSPTLTNCTFSVNTAGGGGGMSNELASSPTLTNCTFSGNKVANSGAGMNNVGSSDPTLTSCAFSGNMATGRFGHGAGMYNHGSSPKLTNCTFVRNSANDNGHGSGMDNNFFSSPTLVNCAFIGNTAGYYGGGMANTGPSSPTLIGCTFNENTAQGQFGRGGGMDNRFSGNPMLTNCTFSENSASINGGGIYNSYSSPELTQCLFSENTAGNAGGIYNESSKPMLIDCEFAQNAANFNGGGMHNRYSSPTLVGCTFSGNTSLSSTAQSYSPSTT